MALFSEKIKTRNDTFWQKQFTDLIAKITAVDVRVTIYIFGSFLSTEFTNASDLDVAVIVNDTWSTKDFYNQVFQAAYAKNTTADKPNDLRKSNRLIDWPLDLLVFKQSHFNSKKEIGGVCFDIFHQGIVIYSDNNPDLKINDILNKLQEETWPQL